MQVEVFGSIVFCIHDQCIRGDLLPGFQAAIDGTTQQQLAEPLTLPIRPTREPAHAKAGHRVSRQILTLDLGEPPNDFGRAECVVAQAALGLGRVRQHEDRADAASAMTLIGHFQICWSHDLPSARESNEAVGSLSMDAVSKSSAVTSGHLICR